MSFPMNSILEELRCMDGELFRSELTQRLYLLLKAQVHDALASPRTATQMRAFHAKILEWPAAVRDEELAVLRSKSGEIDTLFVQVAMLYVKLSHKSTENRVVRISRPRIEDLVRSFYQAVLHNSWGSSGELWKFDPIKLDFVLRECFRKAVMDSVQVVSAPQPAPAIARRDDDTEIGPDDSISNFLGSEAPPRPRMSLPPPPPLERSAPARLDDSSDSDTHSRSSESSEEQFDRAPAPADTEFHRAAPPADTEFDRARADDVGTVVRRTEDDVGTVVRRSEDDAGTVRVDRGSADAGTVLAPRSDDARARTVTFNLPRGPGSVMSSVSDGSAGSRFLTAVMHKPTLLPVSEAEAAGPSLRIEFQDDSDGSSE